MALTTRMLCSAPLKHACFARAPQHVFCPVQRSLNGKCLRQRTLAQARFDGHVQMDVDEKEAKQMQEQLVELRFKRKLKQLSLLQDFADAAIAINDIRGGFTNAAC